MSQRASETLRVLLDCRMADWSGVGRYTRGLVRGLSGVPGLSLVLVTAPSAEPILPPSAGVDVVPAQHSPFSLFGMVEMARIIREQKPDLVHCLHFPTPSRVSVPLVVTMHDLTPLVIPEVMPSALRREVYRFLNRRAARMAARVIVPSESTARDVERLLPHTHERISVIAEAADDFVPAAAPAEGPQVDPPYILAMGNTKAHKDLPVLFAALEEIVPAHAELHLQLAGEEPDGYLAAMLPAVLHDRVSFTGRINDDQLRALYSAATLLAFPSRYEGFGLPPLEAMALGTPVVAAHASSVPEVVGDAALLFPPGDAPALAKALEQLLADASLRAELRARGLARAADFTWAATALKTAAVYSTAVERSFNQP